MRHPIFLHLRTDKTPKEVTVASTKPITKKQAEKATTAAGENEKIFSFGKIKVKATNLHKVFWPEEGLTKGDMINYYIDIADYIMPYLKDRPESLKRNPNGITDEGFFQKDAADEAPPWVDHIELFSESTNKDIDYILCNNKATLTYMNNLGCIEINPWHSTTKALDNPDYLIIDIDPSKNNTFEQVIEAALVFHQILDKAGAANFCKTSGATGLHVYVPCGKKYTYEQIKDFAHLVCMLANEQLPEFTTLERNLKKRGEGMIYLDHLQNRRGQTIACAYSLRPKPGATVSAPLLWEEVKSGLSPAQFNIQTIHARLKNMGDIFKGVLGKGIDMAKCLDNLNK